MALATNIRYAPPPLYSINASEGNTCGEWQNSYNFLSDMHLGRQGNYQLIELVQTSLFPSRQVVLFLLSTKDITESYTASRGPSIYSIESSELANDENKVLVTQGVF